MSSSMKGSIFSYADMNSRASFIMSAFWKNVDHHLGVFSAGLRMQGYRMSEAAARASSLEEIRKVFGMGRFSFRAKRKKVALSVSISTTSGSGRAYMKYGSS